MKRDDTPASTSDVPTSGNAAFSVFVSLADTTWRVAVPTVLFSGAGIALDKRFNTMPLLTLSGLVLGLAAAAKLVWGQLQKINKPEGKQ